MKLLIADDSALLRQRLSMLITEFLGITDIEQTEDVPGTIEAIKSKKPDVVVLDMRMPGGSGIDVLKKVQKEDQKPIIIVFTNYPYPRFRKSCLAVGADFFLDKSFNHNELLGVLKKLKNKFL
ncbi:Sensory transduction protein LytR [subsurface metagenome]